MIKYTKSKPQCSYLKFRVSTRQATHMKFVMQISNELHISNELNISSLTSGNTKL